MVMIMRKLEIHLVELLVCSGVLIRINRGTEESFHPSNVHFY